MIKPFAAEAWRRAEAGQLADEELYPSDAQWSGLYDRMHTHVHDEMERRLTLPLITVNRSIPDVFTKAKRSEVMSRICSRGNKDTELALAKLLRANRITGWRRHQPIFGKPDFIFPQLRLAVLVNGCFWHCCPRHFTIPANNRLFWERKLAANRARDVAVTRTLRAQGWRVLRVWEHELARKNQARLVRRIQRALP